MFELHSTDEETVTPEKLSHFLRSCGQKMAELEHKAQQAGTRHHCATLPKWGVTYFMCIYI